MEFRPVYFNSTTKAVTNHRFDLENAFQEILYRTDNLISKESGWIVELIESQYINITLKTIVRDFSCEIACRIKKFYRQFHMRNLKN